MYVTERLREKLGDLVRALSGCRVGVYAADFGRFNRNLKEYLAGLDVAAIYLPAKRNYDQGFPPERDMERFLAGIDCLLLWGDDEVTLELVQTVIDGGNRIRVVNALRRGHPLSLLNAEKSYRRAALDAWPSTREELQAVDGLSKALLETTARGRAWGEQPPQIVAGLLPFDQAVMHYRGVSAACPACGRALRTVKSFVIPDPARHYSTIFYHFECHEEFYLIKEPYGLVGVYFPVRELFLSFIDSKSWHGVNKYYEKMCNDLIDIFKTYVLYAMEEVEAYMQNAGPSKVLALIGDFSSFGHYVRNELAGVQKIIDAGALDRIDAWIIGKNDHLQVRRIFPELSAARKVFGMDAKRMEMETFRACFADNACAMLVHYIGGLCDLLAKRIDHNHARRHVAAAVAQQVAQAKKHWPLVYVTLRIKRCWISQAKGLALILNALFEEHPGLAVVFDGLPYEQDILSDVLGQLDPGIEAFDALHCTKADTLFWGSNIDLHISPHGNGNYFTLIPNKPGVVHANKQFLDMYLIPGQDGFVAPSPRETPAPCLAVYPVWEDDEPDLHQCDYDLDWRQVLAAARRSLNLIPRRDRA
ncbi:MAG: hypothetical protein HQK82_12290 [Desulfovibrionaceae bacterium]|nr:hypothetical protein [Desulfovibrionaceae bacterium]